MSNSFQGSDGVASIRKVNPSKEKLDIVVKRPAMQGSQASIPVERNPKMSLVDDDFSPLSGKAFYNTVLTQSNLKPLYQMVFGARVLQYLPSKLVPATVTCRGKTWEMMFYGNSVNKRLDIGRWRNFAEENNLKIGDALFWEVMESTEEKVNFKVQIIKGDWPSELEGRGDGKTHDNPIIID